MKKIVLIFIFFALGFILSSCPRELSTTYITIKTVHVLFFSFNENGIFPYLDSFNKNELGIGVFQDSTSSIVELAQSFSFGNEAFADDPNTVIYTNTIEDVKVITLFDFDTNHPAGSKVHDILLHLNSMGETHEMNINSLSSTMFLFKFSTVPQNDSVQFEITGIITNEGEFKARTNLVIFPELN